MLSAQTITKYALFSSLVMFGIRGIEYALIDQYYPLIFAGILYLVLFTSYLAGRTPMKWMIRIWGFILFLYAIIRIALWGIFQYDPAISPHAAEALSLSHLGISGLYCLTGILLIRIRNVVTKNPPLNENLL